MTLTLFSRPQEDKGDKFLYPRYLMNRLMEFNQILPDYIIGTSLSSRSVCVYISSFIQFAHFLSLFELISLLSKQSSAFKAQLLLLHVFF